MTTFYHFNFNVLDLDRSLAFYREALNLSPVREKEAADGSFKLVFLADEGGGPFQAFRTDDYDRLYARHKEMGCVCFENPAMGVYFIADPDGYWIEIVPEKK